MTGRRGIFGVGDGVWEKRVSDGWGRPKGWVIGGEDGGYVWINENRFKIVRQLGEGRFTYVFLVKEVVADSSASSGGGLAKKFKDPSHVSGISDLGHLDIRI
ncbi:hypothetical protein ACFX2A_000335 [Malus domestica]